jgi:CRP-like cAMP-binding protein
MRVVTLWDLLRLDLGPAPQNTIPLFEDLSLRQARIFALMSGVRKYAESDRIINEGEQATDEVFVVIEGELKATIDRDGQEKELSRMARGSVVGEGGAFGRVRSASVTALSEARLLRFTADDLEILRRRYPRIAAIVYRNLNRVQSERMARDIGRVS